MSQKATGALIGYLVIFGIAVWLISEFGWWILSIIVVLFLIWIIKTYSSDKSKHAPAAVISNNNISDLPHDEFGPLFDPPQSAGAYFHQLMKIDPDKSMRLRQQEILRESLEIGLSSKKRDTAESRMESATKIFQKLKAEYSIPDSEWNRIEKRFLSDQKEFSTVKYINSAKGLLEYGGKLKTEKSRKKYKEMAKGIIEEGLSDPNSDNERLNDFLNNIQVRAGTLAP